jgi:hypothetical protein
MIKVFLDMEEKNLSKTVMLFYRRDDPEEQSYKMIVFLRGLATNRTFVQQMHAFQDGMTHMIREEEQSNEMIEPTSIASINSFFYSNFINILDLQAQNCYKLVTLYYVEGNEFPHLKFTYLIPKP